MVRGLCALGCTVTFLSAEHLSETPWDEASIAYLKMLGVREVHLYIQSPMITWIKARLAKLYWLLNKRTGASPKVAIDSAWFSPQGMRQWFERIVRQGPPDILMMNYVYFDGLLANVRDVSALRIIDTYDITSLNLAMRRVLEPLLPNPLAIETTADAILREDFFARPDVTADAQEFAIYDRYDRTIAISQDEAEYIAQRSPRTTVSYIPMTQSVVDIGNTYQAPPIFASSATSLNIQGYLYFVKRVLPLVLEQEPAFMLHIAGTLTNQLPKPEPPGITFLGYVPDVTELYKHACFAICPNLGRTGQQVKIVEAMAYGVPVVATTATAQGSPIQHADNGLEARDAEQFAEFMVELWRDRDRCRKFGQAARRTIAEEYNEEQLQRRLTSLLSQLI